MERKRLLEGIPKHIPDLKNPCPVCLLTKATKINRGLTIDVSKNFPGFMLQIDLAFFNAEIIHGVTSTVVAISSANSYPFGFPSKSKHSPLDILKFPITTLINKDNKFTFIRVDEDGAMSIYFEFMEIYNNMNIVAQTTGVDAFSINGKQ